MGRALSFKQNNHGQMAVFVALLFQVLFVFFAMVINVGLLVHDKINLQNSVDMAAIYGAQRQAEILNAIAHSNYQMRQSWKLLAWRLRVLGDSGRTGHPATEMNGIIADDTADPSLNLPSTLPSVCVVHSFWREFSQSADGRYTNVCQKPRVVQNVARIPNQAPFLPWNQAVIDYSDRMRQQFSNNCESAGKENWYFATKWLASYKFDVRSRKKAIRELAGFFSQYGSTDLKEISGGQMSDGLKKTLVANLTRANKLSLDNNLKIFNSLGGVDSTVWLPDIPVVPIVYYMDTSTTVLHGPCHYTIAPVNLEFGGHTPSFGKGNFDPDNMLEAESVEPVDGYNIDHSAIGVEKNPWYMAYVGVSAKTQPRHPFAPFGKGIVLEARSFAQPFGGRIGPWYADQWQPDAAESAGNKIDKLGPDRFQNALLGNPSTDVPNYSRYPGDKLGLTSKLSLASLKSISAGGGTTNAVTKFDYGAIPAEMNTADNDALAWNVETNTSPAIRSFELEGIAPDLFDITYYSIEPNFSANYLVPLSNSGSGVTFRHDIGYRPGTPAQGWSVRDQMSSMATLAGVGALNYIVQNSDDGNAPLLTSWTQSKPVEYERSPSGFATCDPLSKAALADLEPRGITTPGSCLKGGRTGYSVKIVSKKFLESQELELGGEGIKGKLQNPPDPNF